MTFAQPKYISPEELTKRLLHESAALTGADLSWWTVHHVEPFPAQYGQASHFVVAVSGQSVIFFADDEDEFGIAKHRLKDQTLTDYGLVGDLRDAIQIIQKIAV